MTRQIPKVVDPHGTRASLAELFNETLVQLKTSSEYREKIDIASHYLNCSGSIREARYRSKHRFDGVHLYGASGTKAFTESVLMILRDVGHIKVSPPSHFHRYHSNNQLPEYNFPVQNSFTVLENQENF